MKEGEQRKQEKMRVFRVWFKIVRKARSAGKKEGVDGPEGKGEVRGEPVSCSDRVLGDWLVLTGNQAE